MKEVIRFYYLRTRKPDRIAPLGRECIKKVLLKIVLEDKSMIYIA